jgi:hypothetical protein
MAGPVQVDDSELQDLLKDVEEAVSYLPRDLQEKMLKAVILVEGEAKVRAPHDLGQIWSEMGHEVRAVGSGIAGFVGTAAPHGPYMEYGTGVFAGRGRHWPPGEALDIWAKRHGFKSGYQVARIIGMRGGLRPRKYLSGAMEAKEQEVLRILGEALDKVVRRIVEG